MKFLNKWWLYFIILIGGIFIIVSLTFAQEGQPPSPPSASDMADKMKQELNLNDEQANQITPIIQEESQRIQEMMEQARSQKVDRQEMMSQMEELHKDTESKLSQYPTQGQLEQWKSKQPPQRSRNRGAPPGENGQIGEE